MRTRKLTKLENQFVVEAEAGNFLVGYNNNGAPYALGDKNTENLFSMPVIQEHDLHSGGSCYWIDEE